MSLRYQRFDPAPCGFPRPRVSVLPQLELAEVRPFRGAANRAASSLSAFTDETERFYTRGRYALHEAYRLAGIGPQETLLAPAYHCRTMLDPAISLGGEVLLYPLRADLCPDMDALSRLIVAMPRPPKALLLTHYFGFAQAVEPVAEWCTRHGIRLIEDCSHAYAGERDGRPLGSHGDYAVASPYKYFACEDGGMLLANRADRDAIYSTRLRPPALAAELRGFVRSLRAACGRVQVGVTTADIARLDGEVRKLSKQALSAAVETEAAEAGYSTLYAADQEGVQGLAVSRLLMRCSDVQRIARRRRENYCAWVAATRGLPHCRALFPELPAGCVPYMFPLYIERPQRDFYLLKHLGVPLWRWDEMAVSACAVAADYRLHLIHLPCHQGLQRVELDWMIAAISLVLRLDGEAP